MKFEELSWEEKTKIIDNAKEKLLNEINFEPLYKEIRNLVNDDSIKFENEIIEGRGGKYIKIQSEELIDKIGMMGIALKSIRLETFNSSLAFNQKEEKAYWWGSIDFQYDIADGGSNGMHVLYFQFEDGKYTFNRVK